MKSQQFNTTGLTLLALLGFSANSILCRLALSVESVPALDFTAIRIFAAALTLSLLMLGRHKSQLAVIKKYGSAMGSFYLLIYLTGFSFAYIQLSTASGALLLFSAVQFTMLLALRLSGNHLSIAETIGVVISLLGFLYFVYPQLNTPDTLSSVWMILAGIGWGLYSLEGARSVAPLEDTTSNFMRLLPFALITLLFIIINNESNYSWQGIFYAFLSGSVASGLGYALWYLVLPKLPKSLAAISQLSVPVWAALGGLWLIDEAITLHLIFSSILVLGGIAVVALSRFNKAE